jgi:hypothetical protein
LSRLQIIKKLDYIALKEEGYKTGLQASLVSKVSEAVTMNFEKNTTLQELALAEVSDRTHFLRPFE